MGSVLSCQVPDFSGSLLDATFKIICHLGLLDPGNTLREILVRDGVDEGGHREADVLRSTGRPWGHWIWELGVERREQLSWCWEEPVFTEG